MAPSDAVAVASEDWTPYLVRAPVLIKNLGLCMSMAATREASSIRIPESNGLKHSDLASNLLVVANQGQNSFMDAYSDMLQTGTKTNSMARVGGTIDQLMSHFGDPSADRATARLLDRLQSDVKACETKGDHTKRVFSKWKEDVQTLHIGLLGAQTKTNEDLSHVETAQKTGYGNRARLDHDLTQTKEEKSIAHQKHEIALQEQAAKEAQLQSFASQAGQAGLALSFGMVGAIVGVGVSSYLSASTAQTVSNAEFALEQQRKMARDLDGRLQNIDIDLKMIVVEKKGMDHLLGAMREVLGMLKELMDNIISLMSYFEKMNITITQMVDEHEKGLKSIAADQANGVEISKADFQDFHESAHQFKREAMAVHALSTLYAKVITEVINPGFSRIVNLSHHEEGDTTMVLARKQDGLDQYMQVAEETCKSSALEANKTLRMRMEELDRAQLKKKAPKMKAIKDKEKEDKGEKRGIGRFNPFRS